MLRILFSIVFILVATMHSTAQVRATTESGNKVLLFDNGTWQYEEKSVNTGQESGPTAGVVALSVVEIDSTRIIETKPDDIFYLPSPRLERYFGESGANIRCKIGCSNNLGTIKLHFIWEFPVSDANRYFGWFEESQVIFTLDDGQKIELVTGDKSDLKRFESSNYSTISNASLPLTPTQIAALSAHPLRKLEVGWKKKSEDYDIDQSRLLMDTLPSVF